MQHVSIAPKPPLAEFIEQFWHFTDAPGHHKVRVVPSGTIELVFNLEEDELGIFDTEAPRSYKSFSGAFFAGAYARPVFIDSRRHVMGVHFKPGGAFRFLGIPAIELVDIHVDLNALWGSFASQLREQLCAVANPVQRFAILEKALVSRLKCTPKGHPAVREALAIFSKDAGKTKIRDLAAQLGLSQRYFIKVFSNQVGITPKMFARVQRFHSAIDLTSGNPTPNWAEIAATCGYFDQSHLIHDFQTLSGLTPSDFRRQHAQRLVARPPLIE